MWNADLLSMRHFNYIKLKNNITYYIMEHPNRDYKKAIEKYESKTFTDEEIRKKLKGYYLVPTELWEKCPNSCWYRYEDKRKGFRAGGFITKNTEDFFAFKNISLKYSWSVAKKNISRLWIRPKKRGDYYIRWVISNNLEKADY